MDLIPKAKRHIIRYLRIIRTDPLFLRLIRYLRFSLYLSPLIFLCTILIIKKRKELALKETFNHFGFYQIFKADKNKRKYFINENSDNSILDSFYKFQKKRICYTSPSGIYNYGNNCYMNSLLQCLASSNEFHNYIKNVLQLNELQIDNLNEERKEENYFLNLLEKSLEHINNKDTILYPKELVRLINKLFNFDYDQQDSYELYHRILDILDNFLIKYRVDRDVIDESGFKNPFLIYIKNEFECESCRHKIIKKQQVNDLSVEMSNPNSQSFGMFYKKSPVNLEEKIKEVSLPEPIHDYECMSCSLNQLINDLRKLKYEFEFKDKAITDKFKILISHLELISKEKINEISDLKTYIISYCSEYAFKSKENTDLTDLLQYLNFKKIRTSIQKRQLIDKLPELLVIHLQKISHYDQNHGAAMVRVNIDFDEIITLNENGKNVKYELYSFLQHMGSSEYGHYISFKKYSKDRWVVLNDSECIYFTWEQIRKSNADPYMLFYRRLQ